MDLTSIKSKEEFLKTLKSDPRMVAFEGWDSYGQPRLTDGGSKQTWRTAQAAPWYDAEVEQALIGAQGALGQSAMTRDFPDARNFSEKPMYTPEVTETPKWNNAATGNIRRENVEGLSYAGQLADAVRRAITRK